MGVVLRAVLVVHAVLGLSVAFVASGLSDWVGLLARGAMAALPATLLWLLLACGIRHRLATLGAASQWAVALSLGALCGAAGWAILAALAPLLDAVVSPWPAVAAGAAGAAVLFYWLRLRAQLQQPAEATARLVELESRIRPHFLFNTLNTAMALVRVDPPRAEEVLADLAELFRVALIGGGEAVTLAEEIDLAQRYLAIEQIRFGERLQVRWEIDPAAGAARVPPLLLQPLVENAVRHGVEPNPAGGTLRVRTRVRHGVALINVDSSLGDAPSRPGHGIALRNVQERLRLMHDVAAQFEARRDGALFRVQIGVPL